MRLVDGGRRLTTLGVGALLAAGCGAGGGAAGPATLGPAQAPGGTDGRQVTCEVRSAHGPVTVGLVLPAGFAAVERETDCAWAMRRRLVVESPDPTDRVRDVEVVVTVDATTARGLEGEHARLDRFAVEGDRPGGDDSVLDLRLRREVPTYGDTVGDRLSWRCFCDGQDTLHRVALADGVRLAWASVVALEAETYREVAEVLRSLGVVDVSGRSRPS